MPPPPVPALERDVVLLIDDAPDTVRMLADALEQAGFTVLVATDGATALARLARVTPDAVLLDACMPGMDGFETCRRLKAVEGMDTVPVLFMTGLAETERIVEGLSAGGIDYLVKPVAPDELIARLRAHLRVARERAGARSALELAGMAIASIEANGQPGWSTPSARRILGRLDPAVLGRQVAAWIAGRDLEHPLSLHLGSTLVQVQPLGQSSTGGLLLRLEEGPGAAPNAPALTRRELDVLEWLAKGKTNRDIADILEMSPRTVNKHLEHIYAKLGVETRTAAVAQFDRLRKGS